MPARDALRHVTRMAQRRGRVRKALGPPVVRPVICGDFFQPRRFRRVELLTELCDCFESSEHMFVSYAENPYETRENSHSQRGRAPLRAEATAGNQTTGWSSARTWNTTAAA